MTNGADPDETLRSAASYLSTRYFQMLLVWNYLQMNITRYRQLCTLIFKQTLFDCFDAWRPKQQL